MTNIKKKFYLWWLSVLLIATAAFWATYLGFIRKVWETDVTMITSVIALVFIVVNLGLGYIAYKLDTKPNAHEMRKITRHIDAVWFMSEQLMVLGMLGTVLGLIHMTANIADIQDSSQVISMLGAMKTGLGYALYTNVFGIFTSMVLKLQVFFIVGENADEKV